MVIVQVIQMWWHHPRSLNMSVPYLVGDGYRMNSPYPPTSGWVALFESTWLRPGTTARYILL